MAIESLQSVSDQLAALIESASQSVVRVDARHRIAGSGIAWASDVILTADHVVEREEGIQISFNGNSYQVELAGRDPSTDIAALRVKGAKLTPAPIGDAKGLKVGHLVVAIGRPWSEETVASVGVVSGRGFGWRGLHSQFRDGLIQTDVILYPGFSGGPLIDASGRVVGMNSAVLGRGMALAVPADTATRVMNALLKEGRVRRGYLGVSLQIVPLAETLAKQLAAKQDRALMILTIESASPAEKAGLLPGDILLQIGDQSLEGIEDLQRYLSAERVGATVKLKVVRGGELKEVSLVVGSK